MAALEGNDVALVPTYVVLPVLRSGALVQVLTEFSYHELWIKALVLERRMPLARVRALIEQKLCPVLPPWEMT